MAVYKGTQNEWHEFDGFWLREDVFEAFTFPKDEVVLNIPYVSQKHLFTPNACGPASSLMLAGAPMRLEAFLALNGITHNNLTTIADNIRFLNKIGVKGVFKRPFRLVSVLKSIYNQVPVMTLVNYRYLSNGREVFPHFVVVVGYKRGKIIYHDPYKEPFTEIAIEEFARAYGLTVENGNIPYQAIIVE